MAKPSPMQIVRQADGRHHVQDATGKVVGKHNSVFSAARQLHDYYGGQAEGTDASGAAGDVHPPVPHPVMPRPKKDTAPNEAPKRIPRP